MKKIWILSVVFVVLANTLSAQERNVAQPYSFGKKGISSVVDVRTMPLVDHAKLQQEDMQHKDKSLPARTGVGFSVNNTFRNSGRTDAVDGGSLWRVKYETEGAVMTYLVFDRFNIPEEGKLFIYSPDRKQVFGPYTNSDVQETGKLVTDDIIGDEVVVEYYEPANASFKGEVNIAAVMHIYKDFLNIRAEEKGPIGEADGTCHINVACPEADGWRSQVKSVVCISITAYVESEGGWAAFLCSGATINNVRMDKTPYVLSADHCVAADDQTHKFYFNYQTATCYGSTGSYKVSNGGSIVARANTSDTYTSSDFLLLKITGYLSPTFRDSIFFAGWDRTGAASVGAGIHHPGGDWKKISLPQTVASSNYSGMSNKFFTVRWRTNPNKGVTEQGSSGSPLFNASGRIIGTLTSGSSACDYMAGTDNYGKMSYHWTNNNNSNTARKLQPWLDPDNTGATTLDGMYYDGTVVTGLGDYAIQTSTFEIYPNPAQKNGSVTIQGDFMTENAVCNVYNAMGQLVKSFNVTTDATFTMSVNDLDNGVYFVELIGSERIYKSKLIIAQ